MSDDTREIERLLGAGERPVPPRDLLDRIKDEIPEEMPDSGGLTITRSPIWSIAAAVFVLVGGTWLTATLLQSPIFRTFDVGDPVYESSEPLSPEAAMPDERARNALAENADDWENQPVSESEKAARTDAPEAVASSPVGMLEERVEAGGVEESVVAERDRPAPADEAKRERPAPPPPPPTPSAPARSAQSEAAPKAREQFQAGSSPRDADLTEISGEMATVSDHGEGTLSLRQMLEEALIVTGALEGAEAGELVADVPDDQGSRVRVIVGAIGEEQGLAQIQTAGPLVRVEMEHAISGVEGWSQTRARASRAPESRADQHRAIGPAEVAGLIVAYHRVLDGDPVTDRFESEARRFASSADERLAELGRTVLRTVAQRRVSERD